MSQGEDQEKEIKIGRRVSAGKIKQEDLGDGSEYSKEDVAALRAKNAKGLTMNVNTQDVLAQGSLVSCFFLLSLSNTK